MQKKIMSDLKTKLLKSYRLENCLRSYNDSEQEKKAIRDKFTSVWGSYLAGHFLSKYDNADSLIWALDDDNLKLFIDKF